MDISTEKAFDLLPYAVEIFEKLKVDKYIEATRKKYKIQRKQGKQIDDVTAGIDIFKFVLKNLKNVEEEVFHLLAIIEDKEVKEIKEQSLMITIKSLRDLLTNKELVELFRSAM